MGQEFEVGRHGVTFACGPNMTDFVHPLFVGRVWVPVQQKGEFCVRGREELHAGDFIWFSPSLGRRPGQVSLPCVKTEEVEGPVWGHTLAVLLLCLPYCRLSLPRWLWAVQTRCWRAVFPTPSLLACLYEGPAFQSRLSGSFCTNSFPKKGSVCDLVICLCSILIKWG